MAKKNSKKRTIRNGRLRTKETPLRAYVPMQIFEWKSKLPEMLLIVGLTDSAQPYRTQQVKPYTMSLLVFLII